MNNAAPPGGAASARRSLRLASLICLLATPAIAAPIPAPPAVPPPLPAPPLPSLAARTATLIVPDLHSPVARRMFTDRAQAICGRTYVIAEHTLNVGAAPGTVLSQNPPPGSQVRCQDPVTVQISLGPAPAPATPPVPGLAALDPRTLYLAVAASLAIALLVAWRLLAHRPPTKRHAPPADYDIVRNGAGTVTAIVVVQPIGRAVPDIAIDLRIVAASCTATDPLPITHLEYHDERNAHAWRAG